jgi:hypothetical protein
LGVVRVTALEEGERLGVLELLRAPVLLGVFVPGADCALPSICFVHPEVRARIATMTAMVGFSRLAMVRLS